jgi:hypothetical protein
MGKFHRYAQPSYFLFPGESFPALPGGTGTVGTNTYDYVNVVSAGVGAGDGSANTDVQKASGPNQFTYFVAFGEDATSLNANRGFKAAFESLDVLDDVVRTSLPKLATVSGASPSANGIQIVGDVWCGSSALTPADSLVGASDSQERPLYNGINLVAITDIDNGTPGNSVIGTGWVTNPTVRFSLPVVSSYVLYYGARTSLGRLAESEPGAWWTQDIEALNQGHRNSGIFQHGLDELYRRSSAPTTPNPPLNTPGSGAFIVRDGPSVRLQLPTQNWGTAPYPDKFLAGYAVSYPAYNVASSFATNNGGDTGLLALAGYRSSSDAAELSAAGPLRAAVATQIPRNVNNANWGGSSAYTRIPAAAAATLNVGGSDSARVTLTAPSFFRAGSSSAVYSGIDVLEVDFGGGDVRSYLIELDFTLPGNEARLRSLAGGVVSFTANTAVTVTWHSVMLSVGGTRDYALTFAQPKGVSANRTAGNQPLGGFRFISDTRTADYDPTTSKPVMVFDAYFYENTQVGAVRTMEMYASGSILSQFNTQGYESSFTAGGWGRVHHTFTHRTAFSSTPTGTTFFISPDGEAAAPGTVGMGFGALSIGCTGAGLSAYVLNFTSYAGSVPGTVCELYIENYGDGVDGLDITINWDSNFIFSDAADGQFGTANLTKGAVIHIRLTSMLTISSNGPKWFVERLATYYL